MEPENLARRALLPLLIEPVGPGCVAPSPAARQVGNRSRGCIRRWHLCHQNRAPNEEDHKDEQSRAPFHWQPLLPGCPSNWTADAPPWLANQWWNLRAAASAAAANGGTFVHKRRGALRHRIS